MPVYQGVLAEFSLNKAMLFELFHPYGITDSLAGDLQKLLISDTGKQLFTSSHRILRNRNEIIASPLEEMPRHHFIVESVGGLLNISGVKSASVAAVDKGFTISRNPLTACIDHDLISFPLVIRGWKKGDYFYPFGQAGRKKLSDYFTDRKYSLFQKEKALILESEGKIVWLMGERLDNRFRVTASTATVLTIEMNDPREDNINQ